MEEIGPVHQLLQAEAPGPASTGGTSREEARRWLGWSILGYEPFDPLGEPPLGYRAIALRRSGTFVGACGLVP